MNAARVGEGGRMAALASLGETSVPALPTDDQIVALWLHGRSAHTVRAYAGDAARFRAFVDKPLARVTLPDLQAFADALRPLAASSQGGSQDTCKRRT